jgi:cytochrome c553
VKRRLKELTILLGILGVIGLMVLVSGIVPVAASSGHWAVTRWVLDFASDRSVDFHSSGIQTPELDDPGMVRLGAATYESNCRWCHGRPGLPAPVVASRMTPKPPYLPDAALDHEPRALFYIVKHGIKFAGMPAWSTQLREDDVWPVVAFLKTLPDMSEEAYLHHVSLSSEPLMLAVDDAESRAAESRTTESRTTDSAVSDLDSPQTQVTGLVADDCGACHGEDGNGRAGERVPVIAGQSQAYLKLSLQAYQSGDRYSGIMQPIAARLTDEDIDSLSQHYSAAKRSNQKTGPSDRNLFADGQSLANEGDSKQKIPSCVDCHGPGSNPRSNEYPQLAGQPVWFIRKQLELFASRSRGGSKNANLMHPIADKLSDEQIDALAVYFSYAVE